MNKTLYKVLFSTAPVGANSPVTTKSIDILIAEKEIPNWLENMYINTHTKISIISIQNIGFAEIQYS